jgi:hypothetical protein
MSYRKHRDKGRLPVPGDKRRACLCADLETYSRECCEGELINQGIGSLENHSSSTITFVDGSEDIVNISGDGQDPNIAPDPSFDCLTLTLSGFNVAQDGTITLPTTDLGTITATTPASFDRVNTVTVRTLTVTIEAPAGYLNAGSPIECTTTATQPSSQTFSCADIGATGFAVAGNGTITDPTLALGTIVSKTPTSFATNTTGSNITRTATYTIEVPAGYYNSGSNITCDLSASQTPVCQTDSWYYFEIRNNSFSDILNYSSTGPLGGLSGGIDDGDTQVVVARQSSEITITGGTDYTVTQKGYAGVYLNAAPQQGFVDATAACGSNINSSYFAHFYLPYTLWDHGTQTDPNNSSYVDSSADFDGQQLFRDNMLYSTQYTGGRTASHDARHGVKFTCSGSPSHSVQLLSVPGGSISNGTISNVTSCA